MAYLVFSTPEQFRLALIAGLVPADRQRQTVWAAVEPGENRIWIDWPDPWSEAFVDCQRFAVAYVTPPPALSFQPRFCWAELLPCHPDESVPSTPCRWLLELPMQGLARSLAQLLPPPREPLPLMILDRPGKSATALFLLDQLPVAHDRIEDFSGQLYRECVSEVWIAHGWTHPLWETLRPPASESWLIAPGAAWQAIPRDHFHRSPQVLPLPDQARNLVPGKFPPPQRERARLPISVRLVRAETPAADEQLWVLTGAESRSRLTELAKSPQAWLRQFQVARARRADGEERLLIRSSAGKSRVPLLAGVPGWTCLSGLPQLFVPSGYRLSPALKPAFLMNTLALTSDEITWIEPAEPQGWQCHRLPRSAFQALPALLDYCTPAVETLTPWTAEPSLVALPSLILEPELSPGVEPVSVVTRQAESEASQRHPLQATKQWLSKSLKRIWARTVVVSDSGESQATILPETFLPSRVSSDDDLSRSVLIGREWASRREALEQAVIHTMRDGSRSERARLWAELAHVYEATGNWTDAAICWTHCGWNDLEQQHPWPAGWWRSEVQLAKLPESAEFPNVILAGLSPMIAARLAAAFLVVTDFGERAALIHTEQYVALRRLVERYADDLPVPIGWLVALAMDRWDGGDPLALARCRDRLFQRMGQSGLALDLDVPAFLRFQGGTRPERFVATRDWIVRIREPLHRWLQRQGIAITMPPSSRPLAWAGLEPERSATIAYADLMLAWGLSQLGDRTHARLLEGSALAILENLEHRSPEDQMVHGTLRRRFCRAIQAAQAGHFEAAGGDRLSAISESDWPSDPFCQYAIRQFLSESRILDPLGTVEPYQGRDLVPLLGQDPLGRRLATLLVRSSPWHAEDAATLLALAAADPGPATVPRILLVLFERQVELDDGLARSAWEFLANARQWSPAWCRSLNPGTESAELATGMLRRLVIGACRVAKRFHWPDRLADWLDTLPGSLGDESERILRAAVLACRQELFQTMHRLGVRDPARKLLPWLTVYKGEVEPAHHGLAIGCFLIGHDDDAKQIIDRARDRLFVRGVKNLKTRTALARAYAAALGYAPVRVALGRYEELFLRLEAIETRGSTNRFFTRQPLALLDTIIRSVVSDEFTLSREIRDWLDTEEFRIRQRISHDLDLALSRPDRRQPPAGSVRSAINPRLA